MLILLAFIILFHITSAVFLFIATIDNVSAVSPRDFDLRFWIFARGKEEEGREKDGRSKMQQGGEKLCGRLSPSLAPDSSASALPPVERG